VFDVTVVTAAPEPEAKNERCRGIATLRLAIFLPVLLGAELYALATWGALGSSALRGLMGMEPSVESVLGEGSTFTISLTPPP
jgi:hypothetical protein